jgi:hypothetical protein
MLRDQMIRSARDMIAEIDRHTADPSTSEMYDALMEPIGPADTRERWEQHLRGLMRLPRNMIGRNEMIIDARKVIAEKARDAREPLREGASAKEDGKKAKTR